MNFEHMIKNEITEMNKEIINGFKDKLNYKVAIYPYCDQGFMLRDKLLKYNIKIDFFCNNGCVLPEYNQFNDIIYNIWDYKYSGLLGQTVVFNADINNPLVNFWDLEFMGFSCDHIITPQKFDYLQKIYDFNTNEFCNVVDFDNENPLISNLDNCSKVYDLLSDDLSKKIYLRILAKRITECPFYDDIYTQDQKEYFDSSIISFSDSEVFVDCGALTGDTIHTFNIATNGNYEKIYAFEPETDGFCKMVSNTSAMKNIIYMNAGVSDKNEELRFKQLNDGSSHFMYECEKADPNYIIRNVLKGDALKINATYIKMDIEGHELKALNGFINTIKEHKPKLAICIYHKPDDLWELPLYMKELHPDYNIFIRHYSSMLFETVCYAIPK